MAATRQAILLYAATALAVLSLVVGAWEFHIADAPHNLANGLVMLGLIGLIRFSGRQRS